jgi:hypothetical protein
MHIRKTVAKVVDTYIQIYFLFINEQLITNMKRALTKVLNRSVIILCKINKIKIRHVVCLSCLGVHGEHLPVENAEHAEHCCLHHWKFCRCTSIHNMQVALKILYIFDYRTKLCCWTSLWSDMTIQVTFISNWLEHNILYIV